MRDEIWRGIQSTALPSGRSLSPFGQSARALVPVDVQDLTHVHSGVVDRACPLQEAPRPDGAVMCAQLVGVERVEVLLPPLAPVLTPALASAVLRLLQKVISDSSTDCLQRSA